MSMNHPWLGPWCITGRPNGPGLVLPDGLETDPRMSLGQEVGESAAGKQ